MKTLIHISDLHFGKVDRPRVRPLLNVIEKINPDMVVISGDLTQRATKKQFEEAKNFIDELKKPVFVVPGNHDISYNPLVRIFRPFKNYKTYICKDLAPLYIDKEIALIGINSVNRFNLTSGRITKKQIREIVSHIEGLHPDTIKIAVCHHPFEVPPVDAEHPHIHKVVTRSKMAVRSLAKHRVDVFLSGHLHVHYVTDTTLRYKIKDYKGLLIQAGTAISIRQRREPVSFNVLTFDDKWLLINHYSGNTADAEYSLISTEKFRHTEHGWIKEIGGENS